MLRQQYVNNTEELNLELFWKLSAKIKIAKLITRW